MVIFVTQTADSSLSSDKSSEINALIWGVSSLTVDYIEKMMSSQIIFILSYRNANFSIHEMLAS